MQVKAGYPDLLSRVIQTDSAAAGMQWPWYFNFSWDFTWARKRACGFLRKPSNSLAPEVGLEPTTP